MEIENKKFRCHGSIILEQCAKIMGAIIAYILFNISEILTEDTDIESEGMGIMLGISTIAVVVLLIYITIALIRWRKTTITLEEDAIIWEKRTLNKKTLTIGIGNISSINLERNLFERIIGTAKLKIDTSSLSTADSTDVQFIFKYEDAIKYKEYLEEKVRLSGEKEVEKTKETILGKEDIAWETEMPKVHYESATGEIVKHCFYDLSLLKIMIGLGVTALGIVEMVDTIEQGISNLGDLIFAITLIITFGYATIHSFIGNIFCFWGMTVERKGNRLYMKYGLLKVKEYVIPIEKINSIHICQTLIGRVCKKYNATMECVGVSDEENETAQITLSLSYEELLKRLAKLLPEYSVEESKNIKKVSKKAIYHKGKRMIIYPMIISLLVLGGHIVLWAMEIKEIAPFFMNLAIGVIIFGYVLLILGIFLQSQIEATGFGEKHLFVKTGTFGTDLMIVPYKKIQYVTWKHSPLSKITKLESGSINILAGSMHTVKPLPYMKIEEVENLVRKLIKSRRK